MTDRDPNEWQEILTGEMLVLKLLGRVIYNYPEKDERTWLKSLFDEDVFSEVPFSADEVETKIGVELIQKWGKGGITDASFEELKIDYTRLLIGVGKVLAPPWESAHFGNDRLLFKEQTLDVRSWYKQFGLELERIHKEPDDNIALELIFLSHLANLGVQALNEQNSTRFTELIEAQREFVQKHPATWVLTWCKLVEDNARTDFYKGLAHLTRGAMQALSKVLDVKLAKVINE